MLVLYVDSCMCLISWYIEHWCFCTLCCLVKVISLSDWWNSVRINCKSYFRNIFWLNTERYTLLRILRIHKATKQLPFNISQFITCLLTLLCTQKVITKFKQPPPTAIYSNPCGCIERQTRYSAWICFSKTFSFDFPFIYSHVRVLPSFILTCEFCMQTNHN